VNGPLPGVAPLVTPETEAFWAAGADGELSVEECAGCGLHVFPPRGVCRGCHGRELRLVPVRPPGVVYAATVNHNAWYPEGPTVFPLVLVEFPEYSGVRFVGVFEGPADPEETPAIGEPVGFRLVPAFGDRFQLSFHRWDGTP